MRRVTAWVAMACTFAWTSAPVLAVDADASSSGNIFGLALTDEGSPMANTEVELIDGAGKVVKTATTDSAGSYDFPCVPNGNYTDIDIFLHPPHPPTDINRSNKTRCLTLDPPNR